MLRHQTRLPIEVTTTIIISTMFVYFILSRFHFHTLEYNSQQNNYYVLHKYNLIHDLHLFLIKNFHCYFMKTIRLFNGFQNFSFVMSYMKIFSETKKNLFSKLYNKQTKEFTNLYNPDVKQSARSADKPLV